MGEVSQEGVGAQILGLAASQEQEDGGGITT
jgi:hypothetical protein